MAVANNPFDLKDTTGNELLTAATSAIAAPQSTGYNAATANSTGYNATNANLNTWNADTASTPVDQQQTVAGQLTGLISANSPLLQKARADSLAQMNSRGLANSSMALGEGQKAVIASALPIAQQDATTAATRNQFNASQANTMNQFNAGQTNAASQFTAGAANTAALSNANAQNTAAQFTAGSANEASKQYATALNSTVQNMMDQSMKISLANADAATKIELQTIDANTRKDLAATEAQYKNQMQASQSANDIFQQISKNIADIMANPDISATAAKGETVSPKQAAVDAQKEYLKNALEILSTTSGVTGLKALVTFP